MVLVVRQCRSSTEHLVPSVAGHTKCNVPHLWSPSLLLAERQRCQGLVRRPRMAVAKAPVSGFRAGEARACSDNEWHAGSHHRWHHYSSEQCRRTAASSATSDRVEHVQPRHSRLSRMSEPARDRVARRRPLLRCGLVGNWRGFRRRACTDVRLRPDIQHHRHWWPAATETPTRRWLEQRTAFLRP